MRLSEILKKDQKTLEDAYFIHEDIRKFRFFENFFAQNLKTLDTEAMLSLCQTFQYEHMSIGSFVFRKGDISNNKFYIILSGQVSVILPNSEEEIRKTAKKMKSNSRLTRMTSKMMTVVNSGDQQPNANASNITNSPVTSQNNSSVFTPGSPRKFIDFVSPLSSVQNNRRVKRLQTCGNPVFTGTGDKFLSGHTDGITEHVTEGDMPENHHNPSQFMECPEDSGKVARRLRQGEAFGELALKNNEPRSATVFCNTDCEFLIITKEQFDKVFSKKEFEKEIFLKTTIPVLASAHSSMRVNVLFYAFKTEAYSRDSYLTTQGKIIDREPKIFVIHHGECIIEKSYAKEVFNPYDRSQPITYKAESLHIAVVGKGTIIGEEILVNDDEYCYNVKAISENVIVHALTKKDLDSSLFKEFSQYLIQMYETKKAQREVIYQNLKREYESKLSQYKDTNLYYMQNSKMKHIINNSAIQGFSKYLQREQRNSESWNELPKPTELAGSPMNHSLLTNISHKERNLLKSHQLQTQMPKDNLRLDKSMDLDESRGLNISFDNTPKAPNWPKAKGYQPDLKDLDQMRFFEVSPKKGNPKRNFQINSINSSISENIKNSIGHKKKKQSPLDELLKGVAKKAKKSKNFDQSLIDVKGAPKTDISEERPAKRIPMLTDTSLPEIVKPYDKTPVGASTGKYTTHNQRSSSNFFLTSNFSPKNNTLVKQGEAEVSNKDEVIETDSPRDKSDIALKHRLPTFEDESTNFYRISLSNFNISVNKTPDAVMTQALDFDASNASLQSRLLSNYTPFEQTKQVGMLTNSVNPRLHGTAVRHSSALLNTRDWRNGIFKKLPRNTEVKVPELEQLKLGCKPKEHMKKASAL